jgi:hypothetical protein
MRINKIFILFLILSVPPLADSSGQIVYDQPHSASLDFYYNSWSLENPVSGEDEDFSQRTLLLYGFMPLRDNFEARYSIATASNSLEMRRGEDELAGLGDLRVQLSHSFYSDRLLLSAGVNLPTGKQELDTEEELRVIEFLSRDYLSLPFRRYGEGAGFNLLAGGAAELVPVKCGATASYYYTGTYTPYSGFGDYNPGNTLSVGASAGMAADRISYTARLNYAVSGSDQLDGSDIYKQGARFTTYLSASYSEEPYMITAGTRIILRGRNTRYSASSGAVESQLKKYGDEFDLFLQMDYLIGKDWRFGARVATRQIASGEEAMDEASVYDFGLSGWRRVSDHYSLNLGAIYHTGSTERDDISFSGLQMTASLTAAY